MFLTRVLPLITSKIASVGSIHELNFLSLYVYLDPVSIREVLSQTIEEWFTHATDSAALHGQAIHGIDNSSTAPSPSYSYPPEPATTSIS